MWKALGVGEGVGYWTSRQKWFFFLLSWKGLVLFILVDNLQSRIGSQACTQSHLSHCANTPSLEGGWVSKAYLWGRGFYWLCKNPITRFPLEVRHVSFDDDQGFYYGGGEGCGDGKIKVGSAVFTSLLPLSGNQEFSKIIDSLEIYLLFRLQRKMKQEMDWGNSDSSESDRDRMHKLIEIFNRFFINFISRLSQRYSLSLSE